MGRKHKHYGGIIGASPIDSNGALRPGVSNLGGISGDNPFEAPSLDLKFDGTVSSFTRATTDPTAAKANGDQLATDIVAQNKTGTVQSMYIGPNGKLINGYVENLLANSIPYGDGWGSNFTPTNNYGTAPDGTQTSVRLQYTSGSGTAQHYNTTSIVPTNGEVFTVSIYYKGTGTFALNNNQAGVPNVSTLQNFTATSEWQRADVQHTADTTTASGAGTMQLSIIFGNVTATNVTSDIEIWGAQLERGGAASQYVPRLNLVPNSIDLRQSAGWGGNLSTTTQVVSGQLDPNGGNNATTLKDDDSAGFRFLEAVTTFPSSNDYWCSSIFVKKGSGIPDDGTSEVHCLCRVIVGTPGSGNEVYHDLVLDPNTGNTSNSSALTGAIVSVQDLGGWYRMIIAGQASGADTRAAFQFFPDAGGTWVVGGTNFTPDAKGSVIAFGPQLERGSSASAYSPTGSSFHVPRLEYGNLRTNLIPQSTGEDLRWPNTSWTSTSFTGPAGEWGFNHTGATLSKVAAPDGTNTAVRFNKPSTGTYSVARLFMGTTAGAYTCAAGATQTVSFWIRNRLAASGNIVMQPYADSNGHADTPLITQSDMPQNEWVRISHTFTNPTNNTPLGTNPARSSWDIEFQTNAAHDFDLWGLQLEEGSSATDYIATYDGARTVGEPLGLLVEESRTNYYAHSQDFLNTSTWSKDVNLVVAADTSITDPTGGTGAFKLSEAAPTGSSGQASLNTASPYTAAVGEVTTLSVFARPISGGTNELVLTQWGEGYVSFNLNNGTIAYQTGDETGEITPAGNGWYRCSMRVTETNSGSGVYYYDYIMAGSGSFQSGSQLYTPSGKDCFHIFGAQVEVGAGATSYIPTSGASVTRAADDITLATSSFGYNTAANTVLASFTMQEGTAASPGVFRLDDGGNNYRELAWYDRASTDLRMQSRESSVTNWTPQTGLTTPFSRVIAMRHNGTVAQDAIDGALGSAQTLAAAPTTTRTTLYLGANGTNVMTGHIRRFTYWPRAINDASLIAYTGTTPPTIDIDRPTRRWGGMTGRSLVESGNVPTTGVLSLAEHYQSKL